MVGSFDDGLHWQAVVGAGKTLCISHNDTLTCENQLSHTPSTNNWYSMHKRTYIHTYVEYLICNSTG